MPGQGHVLTVWEPFKEGFFFFFQHCFITAPQIPLCWRMLGLNPGDFGNWQPDALTTQLDLILENPSLVRLSLLKQSIFLAPSFRCREGLPPLSLPSKYYCQAQAMGAFLYLWQSVLQRRFSQRRDGGIKILLWAFRRQCLFRCK